ncbi:MAG: bifunctional phosphopantothenoylcysteine decarboxylase/phosphopantothenate--cysteine ligase CoaBC [Candidatus Woesearchaeota archaeon]|jgi:phosphopantothenoylcysteine decarboxylase/phosphopantothenate--cysteine ligase|nr:bifunctional phosphopantothenoylcysteine decarboxylase/phosphopantothenate--cysteine ligase CoaBC [Candidatus Woesearchaeota archaeon]MDP6265263.1 bifunctional phosphopantothenoylcysteine decarboxylase/phosphopantothenate--cysteine ligase CoaBC [Candidatus Woesearchaeota archaeon]
MNSTLKNKNIVIGITSSIACYKVLELIKKLRKLRANVHVIMTKSATKLVDTKDFEKVSNNAVNIDLFNPNVDYKDYIKKNKSIRHISLADSADLVLICPATANIIGKIAYGIADDLLSTSIMATNAPVLICPAMNVKMWKNSILQENVDKLRKLRYEFIDPECGILACGYKGIGRLANLDRIVERIKATIERRSDLKGKKILVTAGATSEEIDPVRIITNKSSGKMGVYIAEEAFLRGADVTLIRGINSVEPNYHFKDIKVNSVKDLFNTIKNNIKDKNVMIHAAAVSDFTINNKSKNKIKSNENLHLELTPTTKIFENIKKIKKNILLIGFKAEYNVVKKILVDRAYDLLKSANANIVVANDVGKKDVGFNTETNAVYIIYKNKKVKHLKLADKRIIGNKILDNI